MSDETIVFKGSPSILTRFGGLFLSGLIFGSGLALFFVFRASQPLWSWAFAGLAALAFIYIAAVVLIVKSTEYEVTSERIRVRQGIVSKRTDELELYRANDTSLLEPLSQRMLGLGTIEVRTADASTPVLQLHAIRGARQVREKLRLCIEECRDRKRVRVTEFDQPSPG